MDSIDYSDALRRRWPLLVIAALIGALAAFFGTSSKPAAVEVSYQATNTLTSNDSSNGLGTSQSVVSLNQIQYFVQQGAVPLAVAKQLGYSASVTATVDQTSSGVTLTATATTAADAEKIADTYADQLIKYLVDKQTDLRQNQLNSINNRLASLQVTSDALDKQLAADPNNDILKAKRDAALRAYSTAYEQFQDLNLSGDDSLNLTSLGPSQARKLTDGGFKAPQTRKTRVPIAAGIGLILGLAVAFLLERFDGRLRDRRRAELAFGTSTIAELPVLPRNRRRAHLIVAPDRQDHYAEAYRTLRSSVAFLATAGALEVQPHGPLGIILITSASPAEGKTTTAANLAAAFAETGRAVLVVNADFRRPRISEFFSSVRPRPSIAFGSIDNVAPQSLLVDSMVKGVRLLDLSTLGASAGELARATRKLIVEVQGDFDVVIIDCPPLLVSAEALEFIPIADVALLSARIGRSRIDNAKRAGELVHFGGVEKTAVVLNEAKDRAGRYGRYYRYYDTPFEPGPKTTKRDVIPGEPPSIASPAATAPATGNGAAAEPALKGRDARRAKALAAGSTATATATTTNGVTGNGVSGNGVNGDRVANGDRAANGDLHDDHDHPTR